MTSVSTDLAALLRRARSGSIHEFGDQGPEGSAEWNPEQPIPACLLLHDLEAAALPVDFGSNVGFTTVTELDLSGNRLLALPPNVFACLGSLQTLFLGGPGPKFTPEGRNCNMLSALPPMTNLVHLEHLSLHDNQLMELPETLAVCAVLHTLRVDRNPLKALPALPPSLRVLHLEGCPLGGSLDRPEDLPSQVRALTQLADLQMPDGSHVGEFFGTPLSALLPVDEDDLSVAELRAAHPGHEFSPRQYLTCRQLAKVLEDVARLREQPAASPPPLSPRAALSDFTFTLEVEGDDGELEAWVGTLGGGALGPRPDTDSPTFGLLQWDDGGLASTARLSVYATPPPDDAGRTTTFKLYHRGSCEGGDEDMSEMFEYFSDARLPYAHYGVGANEFDDDSSGRLWFAMAPHVYNGSVALNLHWDDELGPADAVRYLRGEPITSFLVDRELAARLDEANGPATSLHNTLLSHDTLQR